MMLQLLSNPLSRRILARRMTVAAMLASAALGSILPVAARADAAADLTRRLAAVNTLTSHFEQTISDQGGNRLQEARGDMVLARGNRFRWQTLEPFSQLAVSNGKQVWIYDEDLEQVVVKPMDANTANTPALLFAGDPAVVSALFEVKQVDKSADLVTYRLTPRSNEALFVELDIAFKGDLPQYMRLEDALGQMTGIAFTEPRLNVSVDPAQFTFVPPEGTDVIEQGP